EGEVFLKQAVAVEGARAVGQHGLIVLESDRLYGALGVQRVPRVLCGVAASAPDEDLDRAGEKLLVDSRRGFARAADVEDEIVDSDLVEGERAVAVEAEADGRLDGWHA